MFIMYIDHVRVLDTSPNALISIPPHHAADLKHTGGESVDVANTPKKCFPRPIDDPEKDQSDFK